MNELREKVWCLLRLNAVSMLLCCVVLITCGVSPAFAQAPSLGEALDATQIVWTVGGNANWFGQANTTHDGMDAARSGAITVYQQSWMETAVTGPATLTFWWKVSSEEDYDWLKFSIDNVEKAGKISGNVDWQYKIYAIASGSHACRWTFANDESYAYGINAGWVDQVQFLSGGASISVVGIDQSVVAQGSTSVSLTNGTDFGSETVTTGSVIHTFFIKNSGSEDLVISSVDASGPGAADFAVLDYPATVSPGGQSNLVVRFVPSVSGVRTATLSVRNSDAANSDYVFAVEGFGLGLYPAGQRYVWPESLYSAPPYTNWQTAAHTIQDAVDVSVAGDTVWVTNGLYAIGGRAIYGLMTNRVAITTDITVQSVNGPSATLIIGKGPVGNGAIRCAYVASNACLSGFTVTGGFTQKSDDPNDSCGGGIWCEDSGMVSNCLIVGNAAWNRGGGAQGGVLQDCLVVSNAAYCGGGTYQVTLQQCVISNNAAEYLGGGVYEGEVDECTICSNTAQYGGGAYESALQRCTISGNSAVDAGGGAADGSASDCTFAENSAANGGGVCFGTLSNCVLSGNSAVDQGGGAYAGSAIDCTFAENSAAVGGGVCFGTLSNCVLSGNSAVEKGGGANEGSAIDCTFAENSAATGGGVSFGTLFNCVLSGNLASNNAGGSFSSTLDNCTLSGNVAQWGGGVVDGTLYNCMLFGNTAETDGGGAYLTTLYNCTVLGNSVWYGGGGGVVDCVLYNSVVYYNRSVASAEGNCMYSTLRYCCTTPDTGGAGNITNVPCIVSLSNPHLLPGSPCIDRGDDAWEVGDEDIDSENRRNGRIDIGCDEAWSGSETGDIHVAIQATHTQVVARVALEFEAEIEGQVQGYGWSFGDGTTDGSVPVARHAYSSTGDYLVVLQAWNLDGQVAATQVVHIAEACATYVRPSGGTPTYPYTNWETAAHDIQSAVDAQGAVGGKVLVTNGTYATGGRVVHGSLTNRLVIDKPVCVESVNGPEYTFIVGNGPLGDSAVRCVYVADSAVLSGFTLSNGCTRTAGDFDTEQSGGGVWCASDRAVVRNCILLGNAAADGGGGVCHGATFNSSISGNSAGAVGGGVYWGDMYNCTIMDNTARDGGGVGACTLYNSIVYYNRSVGSTRQNWNGCTMFNCCTTPDPEGMGNISNVPCMLSLRNPHLLPGSPCIDRGDDACVVGNTDIDGENRRNGRIDIGCDEVWSTGMTGIIDLAIGAAYTQAVTGAALTFESEISGQVQGYAWIFGDGAQESSTPEVRHAYASAGDYLVVLQAWNLDGQVAATQVVHIVDASATYARPSGGTPTYPYTNWETAAHDIQSAVDAQGVVGGKVLVTNGTYATGGRVVHGSLTNRLVIDKPVRVESVNGPEYTFIVGIGPPGDSAVRCVYLADSAMLSGFTLTNGSTRSTGDVHSEQSGGAVWCESYAATVANCRLVASSTAANGGGIYNGMISDSVLSGNSAGGDGGGAWWCGLYNCVLSGNSAGNDGGAAWWCELYDCALSENLATGAGGVWGSRLDHCTLSGNAGDVGGACVSDLYDCTLTGNSGEHGGGAYYSTLYNSTLSSNTASFTGGAACFGTLYNCLLFGNLAGRYGGGASEGYLHNCTVVGNSATQGGGGVDHSTLQNCIIEGNVADQDDNYRQSTFRYCCTMPDPDGIGNITNAPQFMDPASGNYRLRPSSPCIDRGMNQSWMFSYVDLDGNPRIRNQTLDMGAYEFAFSASLRGLLQGPYVTNLHAMVSLINTNLPVSSPYSSNARSVVAAPSNSVDWALVEVLDTNSNVLVSKSVFIDTQGQICDIMSNVSIPIEVSHGEYCLSLKHRNHLAAMSAFPVAFTNTVVSYDFTTGPDKYFGGTNACVELESGVWGMISGDADGDGKITPVDRAIVSNLVGKTGYLSGDLNLDGKVDGDD